MNLRRLTRLAPAGAQAEMGDDYALAEIRYADRAIRARRDADTARLDALRRFEGVDPVAPTLAQHLLRAALAAIRATDVERRDLADSYIRCVRERRR